MKTYLPRTEALQTSHGVWCVEAAWMDQLSEAYYLGGDFDGRNDCFFYYMVWRDPDFGTFSAGFNFHGQATVPFSKTRCASLGAYATLREAFNIVEEHALARMIKSPRYSAGLPEKTPTAPTFDNPFFAPNPTSGNVDSTVNGQDGLYAS